MKTDRTSKYLLLIVVIVAIVALTTLSLRQNDKTLSYSSLMDKDIIGFATASATCSDTDGGLVYTMKGTISGGTWKTTGATYSDKTDFCSSKEKLQEYYCSSNTTGFSSATNCTKINPNYVCSNGACVNATKTNATNATNATTTTNVTNATNTTALPDIIITEINFVKINETNNITVNFTIKNNGTADAGYIGILHTSFWIEYTDTDGSAKTSLGTGYQYVSSYYDLKAGQSITGKITSGLSSTFVDDIRAGTSHTVKITLSSDWTNHIKESDETNNDYTQTVTLTSSDVS